jgi:ABC-type uncharacterized transport system involved in gliding motility auxiliary subunit
LTQALAAAEKKITALSSHANGEGESAVPELSVEQKAEITKFQQEKLSIRKKLREVQRQLNSDVENLGMVLKIINITAVPVVLTLVALVFSLWRRRHKRKSND